MGGFRERLARSSSRSGPMILAADLDPSPHTPRDAAEIMEKLGGRICGIKLNLQVLLRLGINETRKITSCAGRLGLQSIADVKLNDIGNTNAAVLGILWDVGFDAVIANPIMGPSALADLAESARAADRGVISLCHMSSPEGAAAYEMPVSGGPLYKKFLEWGIAAGVDGVVAGATFPDIIRECRHMAGDRLDIVSPGVGAQGGSARMALDAGSDYIIVGRSLLNSENPAEAADSIMES